MVVKTKTQKTKTKKTKTQKTKTQKTKTKMAGVVKYLNGERPKHIKVKNNDCSSQVFQLLRYTNKFTSEYLQDKIENREYYGEIFGINHTEIVNMMNGAYEKYNNKKGSFEWIQLKIPSNYTSLKNYKYTQTLLKRYIKSKTGTFFSIYYTQNVNSNNGIFNTLEEPIGHVVSIFRKYVKKKSESEFYIRDPQMRYDGDSLYKLDDYIKMTQKEQGDYISSFYIIINTKNETLEKFQITPDIIDTYFIDPLEFKQHNSPIPNNMNNDYVIE
jgi:hypothetical protein